MVSWYSRLKSVDITWYSLAANAISACSRNRYRRPEGSELVLFGLRELAMLFGRGVLDLLEVVVEPLRQVNVVLLEDRGVPDPHDVRVFHGLVEATDAIGERHIRANGGRERGEERMNSRTALFRS